MEQLFKRAQKPYVQHLKKVEKAKQNYYSVCNEAKIVMNKVRYALAENVKLIPPQVNKKNACIYREYKTESHNFIIIT